MHCQAASRPMLEVRREARRERLGLSLVYAVRLVEHPVTQIHEGDISMSQPTHCLRCEHEGPATKLCSLHVQAPAMREALEELCASVAPDRFGSGRPIWYDRARAILKAIAP